MAEILVREFEKFKAVAERITDPFTEQPHEFTDPFTEQPRELTHLQTVAYLLEDVSEEASNFHRGMAIASTSLEGYPCVVKANGRVVPVNIAWLANVPERSRQDFIEVFSGNRFKLVPLADALDLFRTGMINFVSGRFAHLEKTRGLPRGPCRLGVHLSIETDMSPLEICYSFPFSEHWKHFRISSNKSG